MRHRRIVLSVVVLLLAAVVVGGILTLHGWRQGTPTATAVATRGTISNVIVATGRVEPLSEVVLANKIPGRVKTVLVKEGDRVVTGAAVILFDDDEFRTQVRVADTRVATAQAEVRRAQRAVDAARARWREIKSGARTQEIERARAELHQTQRTWENAERERTRSAELFDRGLIAQAQHEAASTEAEVRRAQVRAANEALKLLLAGPKPEAVATAWAQVREAEADLSRIEALVGQAQAELQHAQALLRTTVVQSTVDGTVTHRLVEPGSAVDIGIPLMILAENGKTLARAEIDETDVGKLDVGLEAEITADAYPGRVFKGRIIEIGQAIGKRKIRPESPTKIQDMKILEAKIELTEGQKEMKLGMTVDVRIRAAGRGNTVIVPRSAVSGDAGDASVQLVGARGIERRRVRLGLRDEINVEVVDGLAPGERVALSDARR